MQEVRTLYRADCLEILEDYIEPGTVDLIYLDPPFNSNSTYNLPFKGKNKTHAPGEAFVDTWTWDANNDIRLSEFWRGQDPLPALAAIVETAQRVEHKSRKGRSSLAAYLLNMADRLVAMRQALKHTGTIYLHCDPTASHYLKIVMDAIFGRNNFLNEVIWHYGKWTNAATHFQKNHDVLLVYAKNFGSHTFNKLYKDAESYHYDKGWHTNTVEGGISQLIVYDREKAQEKIDSGIYDRIVYKEGTSKAALPDVWDIPIINPMAKERLGYPTQKPLDLLDKVIQASSNEGDLILDPFCGCGTTVHAAEELDRQWIGIDIAHFAVGLIHERVVNNFEHKLRHKPIKVFGIPETPDDARRLAQSDRFEFEKWACGKIGCNGVGKRLGARGPDGGIDGFIELATIQGSKAVQEHAVVQVKSGHVTADSVRALSEVVRRTGAVAGIMVCFADQMSTVENQRNREVWSDAVGTYPVIQGLSIEDLLAGKRPLLPSNYGKKRGGRVSNIPLL